MESERRNLARRSFSYYMRVMDDASGKLLGHISDISSGGFKMDSNQLIPLNSDIRLTIDQIGEISSKMSLTFKARAMWCRQDLFDPNMYNVGFKIVDMTPSDHDIFLKMYNAYGAKDSSQRNRSSLK
jgi:hypothetical protein